MVPFHQSIVQSLFMARPVDDVRIIILLGQQNCRHRIICAGCLSLEYIEYKTILDCFIAKIYNNTICETKILFAIIVRDKFGSRILQTVTKKHFFFF